MWSALVATARGALWRARTVKSSACAAPTRRCARRRAPRWSCMRRRRRRGSGSTAWPRATCSNSTPSCGRRASACRRRAASPRRSTSIPPTSCRRPAEDRHRPARRARGHGGAGLARDADTALAMARGNWPWGAEVLAALGLDPAAKKPRPGAGLDVWKSLPEWEEPPPATPPGSLPVEPREARPRLAQLVASGPNLPELRPTQSDYASAAVAGLRAARARGRAQRRAGRGRHRRRQDAGLSRAGQPVGREERRAGLDLHLHPQPAAPDRPRARPAAPRSAPRSAAAS